MRFHTLSALSLIFILSLVVSADSPQRVPLPVADADAKTQAEMKPYTELLEHTEVEMDMLPIAGGQFLMGSPESEEDRGDDESPQHKVTVAPFWMSKCEITWDAYDAWGEEMDQRRRELLSLPKTPRDIAVDGVSKPTEPYTDMSFGMGREGYPAICMTQHAARTFCKWLSAKTGRYYRLPTEPEWEYACRAGTTTAYSFGDDPDQLDEYAWYAGNTDFNYQPVGQKKPNPWGLHDMHGNAAEWVLDQYTPYETIKSTDNPLQIPTKLYPRVVRGGGWEHDADQLRSAARMPSSPEWKDQDPQVPRSIWYHTDALSVGFRVVRPLTEPSEEEKKQKWENTLPVQLDPVE
ncbi:formylglycine-generating enzyme family protein [Stieleria varia]|nr:SUMF1/EgtB/PvdO family nonheme iron enzyme [Stieleria varia]